MPSSEEVEHCLDGAEQTLAEIGYDTVRELLRPTDASDTMAHALVGPDGCLVWLRTSGDGIGGGGLLMVASGSAACQANLFPAVDVMHRAGRSAWGAGFATPDDAGERMWCGLVWKTPIGALDASSPEALVEILVSVMASTGVESRALGNWVAQETGGVVLGNGVDDDLSILDAAVGISPSPPTAVPVAAPIIEAPTTGSRIRW